MALLRRAAFLLVLALAGIPGTLPAGAQEVEPEYELKAAFLYNFVKFVDWPPEAFAGEKSPLTICVYGKDPFGKSLDGAVQGERLGERSLLVQRPEALEELRGCHVLFVGRSERQRLPEVLGQVEGTPVLTVGDTDGFLRAGGIINFVLEDNKVRFLINVDAAERSRLRLSSKLLRLAKESDRRSPSSP